MGMLTWEREKLWRDYPPEFIEELSLVHISVEALIDFVSKTTNPRENNYMTNIWSPK